MTTYTDKREHVEYITWPIGDIPNTDASAANLGWAIERQPFAAPLRDDWNIPRLQHHYFGAYAGEIFVGPCNTADEVREQVARIRVEIRPDMVDGRSDPEVLDEIERAAIIALARSLSDPTDFDAETSYNGPGRYQGADDRALVVSLDVLSMHGCADETAGSTDETGRYLARFGRYVFQHDSQGFVTCWRCETEQDAQAELDAEDAKYEDEDID
jgi:hypothetical protein